MRKRILLIITVALLALSACATPEPELSDARLTFEAPMAVNAQGEFQVSPSVRNDGAEEFPGDTSFDGEVAILDAQGNVVAQETVASLRALPVGDTAWPVTLRQRLAAGSYELTWGAPGHAAIRIPFTIVESGGSLSLSIGSKGQPPISAPAEPEAAPEALLDQARSDLAQELELSAEGITIVGSAPKVFRDSSLGVPEPGRVYSQVITPGYVITLEVDSMIYTYHGAGDRIVQVPPEGTADEGASLAQQAAVDLAARLGLPLNQVTIQETVPAMFRDSSLGVAEPGQVYLPAVTPGYIIRLEAGGKSYTYHASGERVVLVTDTGFSPRRGEAETLTDRAIEDLAGRLHIAYDKIAVASVTPTEFNDSSLGVPEEGKFYLQVITPGYIIVLEAGGKTYTYHAAGQRVVRVPEKEGAAGATPAPSIVIEAVRVTARGSILFAGTSILPDGTCLRTRLLADGEAVAWWPTTCATVRGGKWEMVVALGSGSAPTELDKDTSYQLRAWPDGDEAQQAEPFEFDLTTPPTIGVLS